MSSKEIRIESVLKDVLSNFLLQRRYATDLVREHPNRGGIYRSGPSSSVE